MMFLVNNEESIVDVAYLEPPASGVTQAGWYIVDGDGRPLPGEGPFVTKGAALERLAFLKADAEAAPSSIPGP